MKAVWALLVAGAAGLVVGGAGLAGEAAERAAAPAAGVLAGEAEVGDGELMQAAVAMGAQYDARYGEKDAAGMAALYAPDGVLVSPAGPLVRGRAELQAYYVKRFAAGARGHAIHVLEAHAQGAGGYAVAQFSVNVPAGGGMREERGSIVTVLRRDADGWHMRLVQPSVPEGK